MRRQLLLQALLWAWALPCCTPGPPDRRTRQQTTRQPLAGRGRRRRRQRLPLHTTEAARQPSAWLISTKMRSWRSS